MTFKRIAASLLSGTAGLVLLGVLTVCLSGCANIGYYWQSLNGQMNLLRAARPVPDWIADVQTAQPLKARLALSQRIRSFAVTELHLPDNDSYRRYADLHRRAVVWSVMAAPPYSLTLKTWCFPVTGCVGYHGYFDEADAKDEAQVLRAEGLEVAVYGIPAYSTLGWFDDPLLSTFINYPEGELARMVIHELAHQVVYAKDDTMFNESFATAVERLGGSRWLALNASDAARREYAEYDGRRNQFRALTLATRRELAEIYEGGAASTEAQRAARKQQVMADFRARYDALRKSWGGYAGYDAWVAGANNASFGAQAAYDELVPAFEALFEHSGRDWPRFYDAVKKLAKLPRDQRHEALKNKSMETNSA